MTHGKENTSKAEQVTRDVNRLRIYFDSPAGQGHGEKRGRGGIEGLRAPLPVIRPETPAPPTGPKAMLAKQEVKPSAEPTPVSAASEPSASKEEPIDGVVPPGDAAQSVDQTELKEEPPSDTLTAIDKSEAVENVTAEAPDVSKSEAEDDVEGLLASLAEDVNAAAPAAGPPVEEPVEDAAGDVSMLSARGSVEPDNESAQADQSVAAGASSIADESSTAAASTEPASEAQSPVKKERDVSIAPSVSEAGASASVRATPARETGRNVDLFYRGPEPSDDRISILYERSTRRICIDADVIERVRISRAEGKIELTVRWNKSADLAVEPGTEEDKPVEAIEAEAAVPATATSAVTGEMEPTLGDASIEPEAAEAEMPGINGATQVVAEEELPVASAPDDDQTGLPDLTADRTKIEETASGQSSKETTVPPATQTSGPEAAVKTEEEGVSQTWDICRGVLVSTNSSSATFYSAADLSPLKRRWSSSTRRPTCSSRSPSTRSTTCGTASMTLRPAGRRLFTSSSLLILTRPRPTRPSSARRSRLSPTSTRTGP